MIRAGHVSKVGATRLHVTFRAAVGWALTSTLAERQPTTIFLMAGKTPLAIVNRLSFHGRSFMRIVAGNASQLAATGLITLTGVHLFDFAGEFFLLIQCGRLDKYGPELIQG